MTAIGAGRERSRTQQWSEEVVRASVRGHPSLVYAQRPARITAVLEQARRWADRPFIVQGDRVVTFAEHHDLVDRVTSRLRDAGVRRGDRVALFAANSPEWVATFFAALTLDAIAVPCNGWWSAEEMAQACGQCEPTVVVCDERRAARVPDGRRTIATTELSGTDAGPLDVRDDGADLTADEDDPAVVLFTAGTTDFPKGATLSHRALVANLQSLLYVSRKLPHQITDDNPASTALVGLPLFHIGAIQLVLVPLMTGSRIVFLDGRFEPGVVLEQLAEHHVTMFSGVPTMMERLLAHPDVATRDTSALRTVVLGGAPVDDVLLDRIRAAFPNTNRGVGRTYGLTEAGGVVSTGVGRAIAERPGSSGRLAPVVEAEVRNPDAEGNGHLFVRSPAAMDGYWGLPDDRTVDEDGWVDTGDLGRVDDERFLYVTGRVKDTIIRGGENIAPARVEAVLAAHPGVLEVAVVGLPDADLGEVVGAVIVPVDTGDAVSAQELKEFAAGRLSSFAVPARWWLRVERLPTNDSGKILKRTLVENWPEEPR